MPCRSVGRQLSSKSLGATISGAWAGCKGHPLPMVKFVVVVASNSDPARLVRVIVDTARPKDFAAAAWASLYLDQGQPASTELAWQHMDGKRQWP